MIELSGGSLYITGSDGHTSLFSDNIYGVAEAQTGTKEITPLLYNISGASASFEVQCENLNLLNNACFDPFSTDKFTLQYNIPIMIQARWHKKKRVRKKWLKRYGMKLDTVKVFVYANVLEYHPGHILDDQCDDNGICATFNSFEFESKKQEYILRPDQKRRGIKIEW